MIFIYKKWDKFCADLKDKGIKPIPASRVAATKSEYLVLKHDVETNVEKAFHIAEIENKHGHCGSYYIQAYLLNDKKNMQLLEKMQEMGHEISYHYDVMDSCKGNLELAIEEFEHNRQLFESYGFVVKTVCQHGNPLVERKGYTSNRDFFRSEKVRNIYPNISDIMVNFQEMYSTDYQYYSDAGRRFKQIYDPLNNDLVDSSEKDIVYADLDDILSILNSEGRYIISIHPHRWTRSTTIYLAKKISFHIIKTIAKLLFKIPVLRKIMSRYYFLAKKI